MVMEKYSLPVSKSNVDRCLKLFHYTIKSLVPQPIRRNCEQTLDQRQKYAEDFRQLESEIGDRNIVFIDEVGFSVSTRPKRGRAPRGVSPTVLIPNARSRNISVIAAMTRNGMVHIFINDTPINGEIYKKFIQVLMEKCTELEILDPIFVMDNARIHHYNGLRELQISNRREFLYLPAYSPFLNPIENVFSKWKNFVIRGTATNELNSKN